MDDKKMEERLFRKLGKAGPEEWKMEVEEDSDYDGRNIRRHNWQRYSSDMEGFHFVAEKDVYKTSIWWYYDWSDDTSEFYSIKVFEDGKLLKTFYGKETEDLFKAIEKGQRQKAERDEMAALGRLEKALRDG